MASAPAADATYYRDPGAAVPGSHSQWQPDAWGQAGPTGQPEPPKRSRWPLLAAISAVVVLGAGAGVAFAVLPSHHKPPTVQSTTSSGVAAGQSSPAAGQTPASSSQLPPRQQAAQALAALLSQSGTDRTEVTAAVTAVEDCSGGLSQDETVFSNAASSRQTLLAKLATLPDRSALPAPMLRDLTLAWQASSAADQDFAQWTRDEISQGCSTNYQSDASFQASGSPDTRATTYKKAFARRWAPVASQYGLPVYQWNQI